MSKWVPTDYLDLILDEIALADEEAVCFSQPATYFQACWPSMWVAETAYVAGDVVRPPTQNGFVYECTVGGTSGSSEPAWGTTQDGTFSDGTVTWKTHANYALINSALASGDKSIADHLDGGRALTIAEKESVLIHTSGTVTHTALITNSTQTLHLVDTATTIEETTDDVVAGRTCILHTMTIRSLIQ